MGVFPNLSNSLKGFWRAKGKDVSTQTNELNRPVKRIAVLLQNATFPEVAFLEGYLAVFLAEGVLQRLQTELKSQCS